MPPKQQEKAKKVAIDKTFGMKNKKGGKGQKAVALAQQQAQAVGKNKETAAKEKAKADRAKEQLAAAKHKAELEELFKPAQVVQKVPFGVDPKSVLCINFKNGACDKGTKCKFSHDLDVGRKTEKKDIYSDDRKDDTMDKWDDAKLREVTLSKHGNAVTTTDIVCNFFIQAIEDGKYGWFWTCPNSANGQECKYRHALPPGFVLKSQRKKEEEAAAAATISLEEYIETERHKLPAKLTPVTPESFATWKKTRLDKKEAEDEAKRKAKETQAAAGKAAGMSGRDLFTYNPLLQGEEDEDEDEDEDDWDLAAYRKRTERERDQAERDRLQALGIDVGSIELNGHTEEDEPPDA